MESLLNIEKLTLSFNGLSGKVVAVREVDLQVFPGETLALVGESGCGKTALCRSMLRLHSGHANIDGGKIHLCGREISQLSEKEMESIRGRDISMVFQDPMSSLNPVFSIGRQVMEPMMHHEKLKKKEAKEKVIELLEMVGIDKAAERFHQYPHEFSGGMRQRVAMAIALAGKPKLIIADEPTTSLDQTAGKQVMELLKEISSSQDRGMIFVTHDLRLAAHMADCIAVMKDGRIVENGTTKEIFENPKHSYTQKLIHFIGHEKIYHHDQNNKLDQLEREKPLVEVKHLSKSFFLGKQNRTTVLDDFTFKIYKGEIMGIVGDSGCGKSTLARCMMGIHQVDSGQIMYREGCKRQMIFQDSASAFNSRMTLEQIIAEPLIIGNKKMNRTDLQNKVFDMMDQVELERELAQRYPYDVSGGQRQRAAIARGLITEPDLLIADEPISSLDVPIQWQIIDLLKKIHDQRQLTIMLIAHDVEMVRGISHRIIDFSHIQLKNNR